ncbi:unnamed protein product [Laminaria digitata]
MHVPLRMAQRCRCRHRDRIVSYHIKCYNSYHSSKYSAAFKKRPVFQKTHHRQTYRYGPGLKSVPRYFLFSPTSQASLGRNCRGEYYLLENRSWGSSLSSCYSSSFFPHVSRLLLLY